MRYAIIKKTDVTNEMLEECHATLRGDKYGIDNLQTSKNGNVYLKWRGNKPTCLYGIKDYTYSKIKKKLKKAEWNDGDI